MSKKSHNVDKLYPRVLFGGERRKTMTRYILSRDLILFDLKEPQFVDFFLVVYMYFHVSLSASTEKDLSVFSFVVVSTWRLASWRSFPAYVSTGKGKLKKIYLILNCIRFIQFSFGLLLPKSSLLCVIVMRR